MHQSQVLVTCLARTKTITVSPVNLKKKKKKSLVLPTKPHHKWEQLAYYTIHHNTWNVNVQYNAGMCTEMVQY